VSPAYILFRAGSAYHAAGRIDETTNCAQEVLALRRQLGIRGMDAQALSLTADVAAASGAENAEGYYREALALAEPRGMRPHVAHCHFGLGKLHRRRGNREQAQEAPHHRDDDVPRNGHELLARAGGNRAAPAALELAHDAEHNDIRFQASELAQAASGLGTHRETSAAPATAAAKWG